MDDLVARFWRRVDKRGPDECWPWTGNLLNTGYGRFVFRHRVEKTAHRAMWMIHFATDIPSDIEVCHTCDNRVCVNPAHLFLGTAKDNAIDKVAKNRQARLFGKRNGICKINDEDVRSIRSSPEPHRAIARRFQISESNVRQIRSGKAWPHVKQL